MPEHLVPETDETTEASAGAPRVVDPYEAAVALFAVLGGGLSLLAGIAVGFALIMSVLSRSGLELPGVLANAAWSGYLGAWLASFTFTPFGAVAGAIAGGRWGRVAGRSGIVWLVGLLAMAIVPIVDAFTGDAAGADFAIVPLTGLWAIAFFIAAVVVMTLLPALIGGATLAAGLARLPRVQARG